MLGPLGSVRSRAASCLGEEKPANTGWLAEEQVSPLPVILATSTLAPSTLATSTLATSTLATKSLGVGACGCRKGRGGALQTLRIRETGLTEETKAQTGIDQ